MSERKKQTISPDDDKLRELILLIAEWSAADPKFGSIKLNKLLFHCDFSAYLTYGAPITGQEYFALKQGPAPRRLVPITEQMKKKEELAYQNVTYYGYRQKRPIALRQANVGVFSSRDVYIVRQTVQRFWAKSATEISDESHLFLGWKVAQERETIPYSTALIGNRPPTQNEREHGLTLDELAESHLRAHR